MISLKNIKLQLHLVIAGLIILIHYSTIYNLAVDIPRYDDFRNILTFLNNFDGSISMFLKPSEEHRNVVTRLLALIDLKLNVTINFIHLIVIGQVFLLTFHIIIYKQVIYKINKWLIVPFVFLNYQISSFDTVLWGLVSIQHYGTLLFAILCFYFLTTEKSNFYLALFFAILSTFTFGNGFLSLLIGGFILFKNRNYKYLTLWSILSIVILLIYFYNHNTPSIKYITYYNPLDAIPYFISLIGNFVGFENYYLSILIGIVFNLLFGLLLFKKEFWNDKFIFSILIFCFATLISITLNRFYISPKHAFADHYKFYPIIFISLISITYSKYYITRNVRYSIHSASILVYLFCQIFYLPKAKLFKNKLENSITNWQLKSTGLIDNAPDQASTTLQKSINKGIYKIPEKYLKK